MSGSRNGTCRIDDFHIPLFRVLRQGRISGRMRDGLRKIGPGFYVDHKRSLYFNVREFLAANKPADSTELRQAVWEQVAQDVGVIGITELTDE
jgi:hypothetical protein